MAVTKHQIVVSGEDEGRRLDQFLAARVPDLSRRKARVLLDIGGVFVDGVRVKVAGRTMRAGQVVVANVGPTLERATKRLGRAARDRDASTLPPFRVVYEDDDVCVVDKPAGLLTAPSPESDRTNLADLLARRTEVSGRIYVVHRIDMPTSGLLVFAKKDEANRVLSARFRDHQIEREYDAFVVGAFPADLTLIDSPVKNRRALTRIEVIDRFGDRATRLRCTLETGRTHQIRIHCSSVRHPILGDPERGQRTSWDPPRMALHAAHLGFEHPQTGDLLRFDSPLPDDLTQWVEELREDGAEASAASGPAR